MVRKQLLTLTALLALGGCQTAPNIKQLQDQNQDLQAKLDNANSRIGELRASELNLKGNVAELNRVISVLGTEKSSRVVESSQLRGSVRGFVQAQFVFFRQQKKQFFLNLSETLTLLKHRILRTS